MPLRQSLLPVRQTSLIHARSHYAPHSAFELLPELPSAPRLQEPYRSPPHAHDAAHLRLAQFAPPAYQRTSLVVCIVATPDPFHRVTPEGPAMLYFVQLRTMRPR